MYVHISENFNKYYYFPPDTSIAVEKVLNGEKPGKSTNPKSNNNKSGSDAYNNRNSRNNKLNGENSNKKPRDSSRNSNSNSRKNSLTGNGSGPNSREPSKTRESKSPSKKIISRSNSKDNNDSVPVNGEINGDLAQGLETVIEGIVSLLDNELNYLYNTNIVFFHFRILKKIYIFYFLNFQAMLKMGSIIKFNR